ncbi:MAG TPA: acetyltransferase [Phototrophicaceae bacterium]|nr:acetyltransferase [Phototrophicaceae bacterium]
MLQDGVFPLRTADVDQAVEVWERSVRATHDFVSAADLELFRPLVRAELPTLPVFVAHDDVGKVAGFIGVSDGKVEMLFIDPVWRGQGIGRRLMEYAINTLNATTVDVNEQNEQALGFYLRLGFAVVGRSAVDGLGKPYPLLHMRLRAKAQKV